MMNGKEFTSKMIEETTGMKVNTLHYYIQSGVIIPDIDRGEGTGKSRIFSKTNCLEAIIINKLMKCGIPKRTIIKVFKKIRESNDYDKLNPKRILKSYNWNEYLIINFDDKNYIDYCFATDSYFFTMKKPMAIVVCLSSLCSNIF